MRTLDKNELMSVEGGTLITNALLATLMKGASIFLDVGRSFGTSIRRIISGCTCKL